mmetsp:Transcript_38160/g.28110  ORF Transcript_38160/g.28110 Transcript_38160/m.28110 type:complete len:109 (-) Transcript_38160:307-633(-)
MGGIEEKIYRRQIFKKGINLQTIDLQQDTSSFLKYFGDSDLFELFEFDPLNSSNSCETMEMLLERDGFHYEPTPTLDHHIPFLRSLPFVKGLTLNSNLYSKNESDQLQ